MDKEAREAYAQGRYETALEKYTQLIQTQPDNSVFYLNRAAVHETISEFQQAQADLLKSLKLNPNSQQTYKLLAKVYRKIGKHRQSKETLQKALSLFPQNGKFKDMLTEAEEAEIVGNEENYVDMMLAKVCQHPQIRVFLKEEPFLTKLEMLIRNPSILNQLVKEDKRLILAYDAMLADREE